MPDPETPVSATDTNPAAPQPVDPPPAPPQGPSDEPLGDGGIRALEAERAARKDLERRLKELEPLAAKAAEFEEAQKTEAQRQADALEAAKADGAKAATELLQLQAAMSKAPAGMDHATITDFAGRLRGSTLEELQADAETLFASITVPPATGGGAGHAGLPVENLRPGALPTTPQPSLKDQIQAAEAAGDMATAMELKSQQLAELRSKTP